MEPVGTTVKNRDLDEASKTVSAGILSCCLNSLGAGGWSCPRFLASASTHRPLSSSFLGLPYRILDINPQKKELLRGLWVL